MKQGKRSLALRNLTRLSVQVNNLVCILAIDCRFQSGSSVPSFTQHKPTGLEQRTAVKEVVLANLVIAVLLECGVCTAFAKGMAWSFPFAQTTPECRVWPASVRSEQPPRPENPEHFFQPTSRLCCHPFCHSGGRVQKPILLQRCHQVHHRATLTFGHRGIAPLCRCHRRLRGYLPTSPCVFQLNQFSHTNCINRTPKGYLEHHENNKTVLTWSAAEQLSPFRIKFNSFHYSIYKIWDGADYTLRFKITDLGVKDVKIRYS